MAELTSEESTPNQKFGNFSAPSECKNESINSSLPNPPCPDCKSTKLYRDGLRYLADGNTIQRWLCRKCGLRFSDPTESSKAKKTLATIATVQTKPLKSKQIITTSYQICVRETKNLEPQTDTKTVAGEKSQLKDDIEGLHAQYLSYLEREGFAEITRFPYLIRRLVRLGANLREPESVKQVIGHLLKLNGEKASNGSKLQYVYAYDNFAKMLKIQWERPHYTQEEIIPFIPLEKELDTLIAFGRSKRLSTYLQTLKETYADPSEALRIKRKDLTGNIITINYPVKGHYPGSIQVSNRLISMLNSLPVTSDRFFPTSYGVMSSSYINMRRRCAAFFQNPRIIEIELRSFRHWGGSMLAHYLNGNVLKVQKILRHKRIDSTMKYIQMLNLEEDEFEVTSATTVEEIKKLGSAGWVKYDELSINGVQVHFYKKPKRFGGL